VIFPKDLIMKRTYIAFIAILTFAIVSPTHSQVKTTTFASNIYDTIACNSSDEAIHPTFTIAATGTSSDIIAKVTQSDPTVFDSLMGTLDNGQTWDPTKTEQMLSPGHTATISVVYHAPANFNGTVVDTITAYTLNSSGNDTIIGQPLIVSITSVYATGVAIPVEGTTFAPLAFRENTFLGNTGHFTIQNTGTSPLVIESLGYLNSLDVYNPAFTWTVTALPAPGVTVTFPYTLPAGQALIVTVDFNDSISDDPVQTTQIVINTNSCIGISESLTASIANSGVKEATAPSLNATIIPEEDGNSLEIILPIDMIDPVNFELSNVLGKTVLRTTLSSGSHTVDANSLVRGVYFYRLTAGTMSQSGKILLGQ
jgi:hypothetical protein